MLLTYHGIINGSGYTVYDYDSTLLVTNTSSILFPNTVPTA